MENVCAKRLSASLLIALPCPFRPGKVGQSAKRLSASLLIAPVTSAAGSALSIGAKRLSASLLIAPDYAKGQQVALMC